MNITINGKKEVINDTLNLIQLIDFLALSNRRIAIELNRNIVSKSQYEKTILKEKDVLEIINAVGGG